MRILLVEDDELLGEGTRKGLIQDGYTVDWVKDGALADQALKTEKFDLDCTGSWASQNAGHYCFAKLA